MGIVVGSQYAATFLATYITTNLMKMLHTDKLTPILIFPAVGILIFAIVEFISVTRCGKKNSDVIE